MMNNKNTIDVYDSDIPIKDGIVLKNKKKDHSLKSNKNERKCILPPNKNKRFKKRIFVLFFLYIFFLTILIFCTFKIFNWKKDNENTNETIQKIDNITNVLEVKDSEKTELVNEPQNQDSDYWYYINFPLIQVNFDELMKKNADTVAWIKVNNTNVNYPIVQTDDNNYYLNHSYDKTINEAGWVFMDFRNQSNLLNKNTILYAHSRLDKTMFGSLSKVLKSSWYENKDNHIINISTPEENSLWQIFSVYKIKEENYYITTDFKDDTIYLEFLSTLKKRSKFDFKTSLNEKDIILTLSTCYSDSERTVVHAKLIKKSPRDS